MTDAEIITALKEEILLAEYANNSFADCVSCELLKSSLELIKSQQTEIKRLNTNMDSMVAEHSRLIANAKSEAIKEFAERLKSKCRDSIELDDYRMTVVTKLDIDDLVEGMTGGEENESK